MFFFIWVGGDKMGLHGFPNMRNFCNSYLVFSCPVKETPFGKVSWTVHTDKNQIQTWLGAGYIYLAVQFYIYIVPQPCKTKKNLYIGPHTVLDKK